MKESSTLQLQNTAKRKLRQNSFLSCFRKNWDIYLLALPGLLFLLLFKYYPMYGLIIAFQDYSPFTGISGSAWVGIKHFVSLFSSAEFYNVLMNTLIISTYKIVFLFPIPIFIAITLNEVKNMFFKKTVQTIIYLPHFLSWVVIASLFVNILSPSGGLINNIIVGLGGKPITFLMDNHWFRTVLVSTAGWKESGWGAIIYIAAISGIDQELYEAAVIDGAGRLKQIWYITLPSIAATIVLMLILRLGHVLEAGMDQVLNLYNASVYKTGDIIGTYVYRMGLGKAEYSYSTAVGLFNSVVGFILVISGNYISRKLVQKSIW